MGHNLNSDRSEHHAHGSHNTTQTGNPPNITGAHASTTSPDIIRTTIETTNPTQAPKKGMRKRANIKIATLNMNGLHVTAENSNSFEKWSEINATMKKERIGILALQETHLDQDLISEIQRIFHKRLQIHNSESENSPRATAGVAFVINKDLLNIQSLETRTLIPGRALYLKIKWNEHEATKIINIYAPNRRTDHNGFWHAIETQRNRLRLPKPDFMLGDFNLTEDPIDRAPAKPDDTSAIDSLRELKQKLETIDLWRHDFPNTREYTYRATHNGSQTKSRLDRIYVAKKITKHTFDWSIGPSTVPTDHWMVSVRFAPKDATHIGSGRWSWPLSALNDKKLLNMIERKGKALENKLENISQINREEENAQTLWSRFKNDITNQAKFISCIAHHKRNSEINKINNDRESIIQSENFEENPKLQWEEALLANRLSHLKRVDSARQRAKLSTKITLQGEILGSTWAKIHKTKTPRSVITRLQSRDTNTRHLESNSKRMAELAKHYHEQLQSEDIHHFNNESEKREAERKILQQIPDSQKLRPLEADELQEGIKQKDVEEALGRAKNGSAPGLDGCPSELWKTLRKRYEIATKTQKQSFNIMKTLTIVFQDIQTHGIDPRTNFAEGWMCPIYKKKDRSDIGNYRPITLLNTDYKLLTKTLAIQLAKKIDPLIHKDQAGFIPGRSIFDHIRLTKVMTKYAEMTKENGAVIALDQEKAYDKITHQYLWNTLDAFNLPPLFRNTIKSLYENAKTVVVINGKTSDPYRVTRGVRQGDPLSCFLFDLAIEPMACMIRNNPALTGFDIPNATSPLIINLFADDTVVYLRERDSFEELQNTLDAWCKSSGAKFNKEKTEILPIGTEEYRTRVTNERTLSRDQPPINPNIRISKPGEAIRSLGAWIGYDTDDAKPWEPILDKIKSELNRWKAAHPTRQGKRTLAQTIIGGRTQFLTRAQGMPAHVLETLTKEIDHLIWGDDTPRIAKDTLRDPQIEGGLQILDLKARNEAIEIMWLKSYLNLSDSRPTWALVTDALINNTAPKTIPSKAIANPFLQSWRVPSKGKRAEVLDKDTLALLKIARKHNVSFAPLNLSRDLKEKLPAWFHQRNTIKTPQNTESRCLIENHTSNSVGDLIKITQRLHRRHNNNHIPLFFCHCDDCDLDRSKGCENPQKCAMEAQKRLNRLAPKYQPSFQHNQDDLSLTKRRKQKNKEAHNLNGNITFNPSTTTKHNLADGFRIFVDPHKITNTPASRQNGARGSEIENELTIIYTDGACKNNGKANAQCGAGIWYNEGNDQNKALKIPGNEQSNQIGEIAAIIKALENAPNFIPILIKSDSKYAIEGLTIHLEKWEDQGWIGIKNSKWFKRAAYLLRTRSASTSFQWVKGHNGDIGNEKSDELAKEGMNKETPDTISLEIPEKFDVQGAKLSKISQATAYQGIKESKPPKKRKTTTNNLETIRQDIEAFSGQLEKDKAIWDSTYNRAIRQNVGQFLFNAIHGTHMIGKFWSHISNLEERINCQTCGTEESMKHILTECTHPTRQQIWSLARNVWPYDDQSWPPVTLGTTLGCGLLTYIPPEPPEPQTDSSPPSRHKRGASRLLQILWSEATHLIWVLRCERTIQDKLHSRSEVEKRWKKKINKRLADDKIAATKILRTKTAKMRVKTTWEEALRKKFQVLHPDWITRDEVF
jgi:ribonuclease HI/exonuclease III